MSSKCQVSWTMFTQDVLSWTWSQLCLVWVGFDWLRPLTRQLGMLKCPLGDRVTSAAPKLHPHIVLTPPFSSHEEVCNWVVPWESTWRDHYLTFSLFLITCLHGPHASALSHKYPQPLSWGEADLRLGLLCPQLADSWINLISASKLHVSALRMLNFGAKSRNKYTWYFKYKNPD